VLSVETIEHVLDDELANLLTEVRRVLRPGGTAIVTTPNDEDLAAGMNFCPACGIEYHQWQHVRSWSADSLQSALENAGFRIQLCSDLDFRHFLPPPPLRWVDMSPRIVASRAFGLLRRMADRMERREFPQLRSLRRRLGYGTLPHLVAVARRP
jgi:SAM-dependent methyltransferase